MHDQQRTDDEFEAEVLRRSRVNDEGRRVVSLEDMAELLGVDLSKS